VARHTVEFGSLVPGGRAGENTLNSRLAGLLQTLGYRSADFELLFPTFRGQRKPDVAFQTDRGVCVVSAKKGKNREAEAIATAQAYLESLRQLGRVAEAFAVVYPGGRGEPFILRVLATADHDSFSIAPLHSLEEVAENIVYVARKDWERARRRAEPSITSAIRVLRQGVEEFANALRKVPLEHVEDIFGGHEFFESLLGYERLGERRSDLLRTAASYLFLNQVLFYEVLAREVPDEFPPIAEIDYGRPWEFGQRYFARVLRKDYRPVYDFDVTGKLRGGDIGDASTKIVRSIKALFPGTINHDVLGKVFHNLIPLGLRKMVGAYFTNSQAGDFLATLAIQSGDAKVLDPACGSGTLLVSAYKRKLSLAGGEVTEALHKQFVERDLTGIDIMAFSAHLAAVHLALQAPLYNTDDVRIAIRDSTKLKPGDVIPSARTTFKEAFKNSRIDDFESGRRTPRPGETASTGTFTIGPTTAKDSGFVLEQVDLVIMNPPFTSADNLPDEYREMLKRRFSEPRQYANCITGKLSLQAYFLLLADRFLKPGGRIASVLPFTTFTGKAFKSLVKFLLENYTVHCIAVGFGRSAFSENTALAEVLLLAEKSKPPPDHRFVLLGIKKNPADWSEDDMQSLVRAVGETKKEGLSVGEIYLARSFPQNDISQDAKTLTALANELDPDFGPAWTELREACERSGKMTTLEALQEVHGADLFAYQLRVKGGAFYGFSALSIVRSEERAKKKHDVYVYQGTSNGSIVAQNRFTKESFQFPRSRIVPCVRRLSDVRKLDFSDCSDYAVSEYYEGVDRLLRDVYPESKVKRFLQRIRAEWKEKVASGRSQICLARRIDLAAPGTRMLAVYSSEPAFLAANSWGIRGISDEEAKVLTLWFNSTPFLIGFLARRSMTRGSWGQVDEAQLLPMFMPDFSRLTPDERAELLRFFERVKDVELPPLLQQLEEGFWVRKELDDRFLELAGFLDAERRAKFAQEVRSAASSALHRMLEAMAAD